uniref:Uncharacterized protein n=1 Tax=Rousettus aegyptiacus TaxID=9407 RepID=A0A7J8EK39_ROUAE|nr:hypothetical protein HJG63_012547 [Rousettus aegyptiacus]
MFLHLMSQRLLKLSSFVWILFSCCCSDCMSSTTPSSKSIIQSSSSSTLLVLSMCSSSQILYSSFLIVSFLYFPFQFYVFYLFLKFSLSSSTLPLSSLSTLITSILNSASGRLLISILFSSFPELCFVLSFRSYFLSSHFGCLPVCFYVLGRAPKSPSLRRVGLCSRCPVGPSGTVFLGHLSWVLQLCFMGCVYPFLVLGTLLLFAYQWKRLTLELLDCEYWP